MRIDPSTLRAALRVLAAVLGALVPIVPPLWQTVLAAVGTGLGTLTVAGPGHVDAKNPEALRRALADTIPPPP